MDKRKVIDILFIFLVISAASYIIYIYQNAPEFDWSRFAQQLEGLPSDLVEQGEQSEAYTEYGTQHIENFSFFPIITINKIKSKPEHNLLAMEKNIFARVNLERAFQNLSELKWNDYIASVAREHSYYLAKENEPLTSFYLLCQVPTIHHEGFDFGLYHNDRLESRGIYYFSASAENIFLISESKGKTYAALNGVECEEFESGEPEGTEEEKIAWITRDLQKRLDYISQQDNVTWKSLAWKNQTEIEKDIVEGWMNSPGHRKNILAAGFDETGVGIAEVNEYLIVTQVFITRTSCGYETGPCCVKPGYYPACYIPLECEDNICK